MIFSMLGTCTGVVTAAAIVVATLFARWPSRLRNSTAATAAVANETEQEEERARDEAGTRCSLDCSRPCHLTSNGWPRNSDKSNISKANGISKDPMGDSGSSSSGGTCGACVTSRNDDALPTFLCMCFVALVSCCLLIQLMALNQRIVLVENAVWEISEYVKAQDSHLQHFTSPADHARDNDVHVRGRGSDTVGDDGLRFGGNAAHAYNDGSGVPWGAPEYDGTSKAMGSSQSRVGDFEEGQECPDSVTVAGAEDLYPGYMGTFLKLAVHTSYNGHRPVYVNIQDGGSAKYLFFWDEQRQWKIGPRYTSATASIGSPSVAQCPDKANEWKVWYYNEWSEQIRITVDETDECADTVSVTGGESVSPRYMGTFFRTGIVPEDDPTEHPIYSNSYSMYLFYWTHQGEWNIGSHYSYRGDIVSFSNAKCPTGATSWRFLNPTFASPLVNIVVSSTRSAAKPSNPRRRSNLGRGSGQWEAGRGLGRTGTRGSGGMDSIYDRFDRGRGGYDTFGLSGLRGGAHKASSYNSLYGAGRWDDIDAPFRMSKSGRSGKGSSPYNSYPEHNLFGNSIYDEGLVGDFDDGDYHFHDRFGDDSFPEYNRFDYNYDRFDTWRSKSSLSNMYGYGSGYGGLNSWKYGSGRSKREMKREFRNLTRTIEHALRHGPCGPVVSTTAELWHIPPVIHQTWKTGEIPAKYARHIASWKLLHPHWRYQFWDDVRGRELVIHHFPKYRDEFDRMSGIKRADVMRIVALYVEGGVYADIDVEAVQPFDALLAAAAQANVGVVLGEENFVHAVLLERKSIWLVSNALMASAPGHPFWLEALNAIFRDTYCGDDPVQCTGPRLLDKLSWEYVGQRPGTCDRYGCLARLPYIYFSPNIARWNVHNMVKECGYQRDYYFDDWDQTSARRRRSRTISACRGLERALQYPEALWSMRRTHAVHHWQCSWCRQDDSMKGTLRLNEVFWLAGNGSLGNPNRGCGGGGSR